MPKKNSGNRRRTKGSSDARRGLAIFIFTVAITVFIYWRREPIGSWLNNTANAIWGVFGWGLLFIDAAIATLVWLTAKGSLSSLFYRWNRWLGVTALILATWGILGFFEQGGSFGRTIIGNPDPTFKGISFGILRILLIAVIGSILLAPGAFYRSLVLFFSWLFKRGDLRRSLIPPPSGQPTVVLPPMDNPRSDAPPKPAEGLYKP